MRRIAQLLAFFVGGAAARGGASGGGVFSSDGSEVVWSFDSGLEGWAAASSSEMQIDVQHRGGALHGTVRHGGADSEATAAHLDSPPLKLVVDGRQTVSFRMKYQGETASGVRIRARSVAFDPKRCGLVASREGGSGDHGRADWRVRSGARLRAVSADAQNAAAMFDGDFGTWWSGNGNQHVDLDWREAEAGAGLLDTDRSFAITEVVLVGGNMAPRTMQLFSAPTAEGPWTARWASGPLDPTPGAVQALDATTSIEAHRDAAPFWRATFEDGSYNGNAVQIAELRCLPAVLEARFGIASSPDFHTYTIPLWRRAAVAGLGGGFGPSTTKSISTYLTQLRIYVGDEVLAPAPRRFYDESAAAACIAWKSNDDAGSEVWRVVADADRSGPWVVTELAMYEDAACHRSLAADVDAGRPGTREGALASAWVGESQGRALYDGICTEAGVEERGSAGDGAWAGGAATAADRSKDGTWLGLTFERAVVVRCVALCQSEDPVSRATSAVLQRSDDGGATWADHAALALPAAANVAVADPCKLTYSAGDFDRAVAAAYDRSVQRFPQQAGAGAAGASGRTRAGSSALAHASLVIDDIRISQPPLVRHVTGCVDQFWPDQPALKGAAPALPLAHAVTHLNDSYHLESGYLRRHYAQELHEPDAAYATTFNCPVQGGLRITILGDRLGSPSVPSRVLVGGRLCTDLVYLDRAPDLANTAGLECTLPPSAVAGAAVDVVVERLEVPDLRDRVQYLSYAAAPAQMASPYVSNVAACALDLSWAPPMGPRGGPSLVGAASFWQATAVTGYVVIYRKAPQTAAAPGTRHTRRRDARFDSEAYPLDGDDAYLVDGRAGNSLVRRVTLGNVTTTTVGGLEPGTPYVFAVAAVVEDRWADPDAVNTVDLYGRRRLLPGALVGPRSTFSNATATLARDVEIGHFDANATVNHGAAEARLTLGPSGVFGGEGHHGLVVVGDANVENCNQSLSCCDGFDVEAYDQTGRGCMPDSYVCLETSARDAFYVQEAESTLRAREAVNDPNGTDRYVEKRIARLRDLGPLEAEEGLFLEPSAACGPSLRLTASVPRQVGAVWYARQLNVREGFDVTAVVRASNPSRRCDHMEDAYTHCRARGADGFAVVVQAERPDALGLEGRGLGYEGIANSLAVELDTFYNPELGDLWENHISVQSRGPSTNTAHHDASFAASTAIPDLATASGSDREDLQIRVRYDPAFDPALLATDAFQTTPHGASYFRNGEFDVGGLAAFGTGLGTLSVFVDDLDRAALITPLNLAALLDLNHGRAWIGLTAATGLATYEVHDVLQFHLTALRRDPPYDPPPIVNGAGAHACQSPATCIHA